MSKVTKEFGNFQLKIDDLKKVMKSKAQYWGCLKITSIENEFFLEPHYILNILYCQCQTPFLLKIKHHLWTTHNGIWGACKWYFMTDINILVMYFRWGYVNKVEMKIYRHMHWNVKFLELYFGFRVWFVRLILTENIEMCKTVHKS